jgi:hypothetical protein
MLAEEEAVASAAGASRTPRPHALPPSFRVRPTRVVLGPAGDGDRHHEAAAHHGHRHHATEVKVTVDARALPVGPHAALLRLDFGPSSGGEGRVVEVTAEVVAPFISVLLPEVGGGARELGTGAAAAATRGHAAARGALLPPSAVAPPLHFGALLPGETATVAAVLCNRSPSAVEFAAACGAAGAALLRESKALGEGGAGGGGGAGGLAAAAAPGGGARGGAVSGKKATPLSGLFGDLVVGLGGDKDEEDLPSDAAAAAAASLDFSVTPSRGVIPANGTFPVTLTYTAVDRRPPPSFRSSSGSAGGGGGGGGGSPRGGFAAGEGARGKRAAHSPQNSLEGGSIFLDEPPPPPQPPAAEVAVGGGLSSASAGAGGAGGGASRLQPRPPLPLPRPDSAAGGAASHAAPPASPRAARAAGAPPLATLRTASAPALAAALCPTPEPSETITSLMAFVVPSLAQRVPVRLAAEIVRRQRFKRSRAHPPPPPHPPMLTHHPPTPPPPALFHQRRCAPLPRSPTRRLTSG